MIRVWDPLVRLFHWSLVVAFTVAWLTGEESESLHEWAGYVVAALIAIRVVWGFVGSHYARFTQFVRGPGTVVGYLKDTLTGRAPRYIGHNPIGALMVLAILVTISGTAYTGWLMADGTRLGMLPDFPRIIAPAIADDDDEEEEEKGMNEGSEEFLEEIHETLANLMLLLIAAHIAGVVFTSVRHRENLARAMITGNKRAAEPGDIS
jgi:cytochrome b